MKSKISSLITLILAATLLQTANLSNAQSAKPTKEELETLARELQADWSSFKLVTNYGERALPLALAGLELCPTNHIWGLDLTMIYANDSQKALGLRGTERVQHYSRCRDYLRQGVTSLGLALEKHPGNIMLQEEIEHVQAGLAEASLEAGDMATAKRIAEKQLASNKNTKNWNYGNVIHNANCLLGRVALRDGGRKQAGEFLLKAGQTPGSPQLDSFGPDFDLARELLEAGEKQVVLDYLDLVARFWVDKNKASKRPLSQQIAQEHAESLEKWRAEIKAGKVPTNNRWQ